MLNQFIKKYVNNFSLLTIACAITIIASSVFIGMYQVTKSGIQWPEDGSRYLNNAAMIRDYLLSNDLFSPYEFAKQNYIQYPGFSIPYHPPGYALLLAIWFIIFGVKFEVARLFISIVLGVSGLFFYMILRFHRIPVLYSLITTLLLITSHEFVHWGRSTMSEVPALACLMAGAYYFIKWADSEGRKFCWQAFSLALLGFLCKVTSAAIVPSWIFYLIISRRWRKLSSIQLWLPAFFYILSGVVWIKFSSQFAHNEIQQGITFSQIDFFSWDNLTVWLKALPAIIGWPAFVISILGLIILITAREKTVQFWVAWFLSCYLFQILLRTHFEARYFFFAIPPFFAFIGSMAVIVQKRLPNSVLHLSWLAILVFNLIFFFNMQNGVTGHDKTAQKLVGLKLPGNILLSCWNDADLIFRYRCLKDTFKRQMIRGDRTLAVRVSSYAGIPPKAIAKDVEDVKQILEKGAIRYLVTCTSKLKGKETRAADMILAHDVAISNPSFFTLLDTTRISFDMIPGKNPRTADVFIWRYEGVLKGTTSKIPVIIPTAKLKI